MAKWTNSEIEHLKKNWPIWRVTKTYRELARDEFPHRTARSIRYKVDKLDLLPMKKEKVNEEIIRPFEEKLLRNWENWSGKYTYKELAQKKFGNISSEKLNRIGLKKFGLKKKRCGKWEKRERKIIEIFDESDSPEEAWQKIKGRWGDEWNGGDETKQFYRVTRVAFGKGPSKLRNYFPGYGYYTHGEIEKVRQLLEENPGITYHEISEELPGRTKSSVEDFVQQHEDLSELKKSRPSKKPDLSDSEKELLEEKVEEGYTDHQISKFFLQDYSKRDIVLYRHRYGLYKRERHEWTEEDLEKLKEYENGMSVEEIYREYMPYRTEHSVRMKLSKLGFLNPETRDKIQRVFGGGND